MDNPSFVSRIALAIACLFRILFDGEFAREAMLLHKRGPVPSGTAVELATTASSLLTGTPGVHSPTPSPTTSELAAENAAQAADEPQPPTAGPSAREGALGLLALLQREGRLLDFCEEELAGYPDATVGAAARTVHAGCRKVLQQYIGVVPMRTEGEGQELNVAPGFDPTALRLTGNVVGNPPFHGTLRHHGWKAANVKLPEPARGDAANVLAPAEVEL